MTIPDTYGVDRPWHIWNGAPMRNLVSSQFSCPSRPDIHWDWKKVAATRMDLVVPYPWESGFHHMVFFPQTKSCGWINTLTSSIGSKYSYGYEWDICYMRWSPGSSSTWKKCKQGHQNNQGSVSSPIFSGAKGFVFWRVNYRIHNRWVWRIVFVENFVALKLVGHDEFQWTRISWGVGKLMSLSTQNIRGPRVIDTYTSRLISPSWNRNPFEAMFKSHLWPQKLGPVTWPHVRWFTFLVYWL